MARVDRSEGSRRTVALWLFAVAAMIFAMALIGAITRLTESGLSITEWKPVTGAIPPLSPQAWEDAFALYRETPEYVKRNAGMSLEEFKGIYFWEWLHRLWGRLIGLAYALPFALFWLTGRLPRAHVPALLGLLLLGGLQGFIGWFMVQSGLIDRPSVSHYRLAMHLGLALLLYALCLVQGLRILKPDWRRAMPASLRGHLHAVLTLLCLTILWGAFTAGLDGGLVYNSFPKMNETWVPPEVLGALGWLSLVEDPAAVQFVHRWLALATAALALWLAARLWRAEERVLAGGLAAAVVLQVALGIVTILSQVQIHAAVTHQAGAMLLLGIATAATVRCTRRVAAAG